MSLLAAFFWGLSRGPSVPAPVFIPPSSGFQYLSSVEPGMERSPNWTQDTTHGYAYPRDGEGSFTQQGLAISYRNRYAVRAAHIHLDAATGYGGTGNLLFTITRMADNVVVHAESIGQAGPNNAAGSNRDVTVPLGDYYVDVDFDTIRGGVVLYDGIGISL